MNTWEEIRGNNKSAEFRKTCRLISMVITPEHMQHSLTHAAAMTEVLNVHKVILERMSGRKKTIILYYKLQRKFQGFITSAVLLSTAQIS